MDEAFATSLGNLFQCFFTLLIVKNYFNLNLPSFSLKLLPLLLWEQTLQKLCAQKKSTSSYILTAYTCVCVCVYIYIYIDIFRVNRYKLNVAS